MHCEHQPLDDVDVLQVQQSPHEHEAAQTQELQLQLIIFPFYVFFAMSQNEA